MITSNLYTINCTILLCIISHCFHIILRVLCTHMYIWTTITWANKLPTGNYVLWRGKCCIYWAVNHYSCQSWSFGILILFSQQNIQPSQHLSFYKCKRDALYISAQINGINPIWNRAKDVLGSAILWSSLAPWNSTSVFQTTLKPFGTKESPRKFLQYQ